MIWCQECGLGLFRAGLFRLSRTLWIKDTKASDRGLISYPTYLCLLCSKTYSKHRFHVNRSVLAERACLGWRDSNGLNLLKGEIEMMLGTVVHTTRGGTVYSGVSRSGCGCSAHSTPQQCETAASHTGWGRDAQTGTARTSGSSHPWETQRQAQSFRREKKVVNVVYVTPA